MRWTFALALVLTFIWNSSPASANKQIDALIVSLQNQSYKVRLTAVLGLSKYNASRARMALRKRLKDTNEHPYVRGFAALGLARQNDIGSLEIFRKVYRKSWRKKRKNRNYRYLYKKLKKAMKIMCPYKTRGKKYYIDYNLRSFRTIGPYKNLAQDLFISKMTKSLKSQGNVTFTWNRCKRPKRWMLRRKRIAGYYLNIKIKLSSSGDVTKCKIGVIIARYPGNAIKSFLSASAQANSKPNPYVIKLLINSLTDTHAKSVKNFLNSL